MVRILRRLKIDHVASVDRGAGDGVKIVLMKRAADTSDNSGNDDGFQAALDYLHSRQGAAVVRRFFPHGASPEDIEHLARLFADGDLGDDADDADETEKVHMDREEVLKSAVRRDGGIVGLCKRICKQGAGDISEHELTSLITEHALVEHPDMSAEGAFTKAYMSAAGEPLRKAIAICGGRLAPAAPVADADVDTDDAAQAYAELVKLAEVQIRKSAPYRRLSQAQAFAMMTQQYPALARRAVGKY
jgi:hypothetical protein